MHAGRQLADAVLDRTSDAVSMLPVFACDVHMAAFLVGLGGGQPRQLAG